MATTFIQGEKYLWKLASYDACMIADLAAEFNLSFPVVQTLIHRGHATPELIKQFLFSTKEHDVAHPSQLKDAQKAVARIIAAIENKEQILIFGDYDVDGITSSALMMICLLPLGAQVNFFLPHRVRDGYGISTTIIERAARNNYKVVITVDNGITAIAPALKAKELGVDLIITDHHKPHDHVPDAYAVVNPQQYDCPYPFKVLAGVGVTFKVLSLLYEALGRELPSKAYELLLLGTIADVVPLLGENRFWVRHGLSYIHETESFSFQVLKQNGKITKPRISSTDIGFGITPQINALGRLEDPRQGVKFLIGTSEQDVRAVGSVLLELNETRKEIERSIVQEIIKQVEEKIINLETDAIIIAVSDNWPPGVIGLVASRIVSLYGRPTILLHRTSKRLLKGSCRSIPEFNMFNALHDARHLLQQFGGHAQAAGLSLHEDQFQEFKDYLNQLIKTQLTPFDLQPKLTIDAEINLVDLNKKLIDDLTHLEPFGHQNGTPLFYVPQVVQMQKPVLLKDAHVKCTVFADGVIKPVIFFNRPELHAKLLACQEPFALVAQIQENHWNGRITIELNGLDVAFGARQAGSDN